MFLNSSILTIPTAITNKDKSGQLAFLLNQSISFVISVNFENLKNYTNVQKRFKDCSDYRATSLHSIIEKNIRLMYNRRYSFLEKKELLYSLQFGFRSKHSTTHTVAHLADQIRN